MIMRIPILKSILRNLDWFEEARRHHVTPDGSIFLGGTNHRLKKDGDWEESKHPRADDGKFTSGSGGGSKKPSKTKRKLERRAEAASQGRVSGAIQTLLSGGSALDKIGWLNTSKPKEPEKAPEKAPEQKPEPSDKPKTPLKPEQIRRAQWKVAGILHSIFIDSWGDKKLSSYEASVLDFLSDQRDNPKPLTDNQKRFFRKLALEGAKSNPQLAANYLSETVLQQIGLGPVPNAIQEKPTESKPQQPEKPKVEEKPEPQNEGKVSFSDIAGESTKSLIKVDGDVDYTKPYIIRISGKTYDHSKNLKSLGFKWGATSKTWYMGIEPKDAESGKNAILQHIQGVSEGRNAIGELKATVSQGKLVPKKPSSQRAAPTPAPKPFPSNPNDGKPGPIPAHEMGSLLSDIDDMEMEIVRYNARRDWEPEVKLSAPISELRRKIEDARARYKESSDRLTSAARYEILSEFEYNKIKQGRRSGPTEKLRELGEKGGLYKK